MEPKDKKEITDFVLFLRKNIGQINCMFIILSNSPLVINNHLCLYMTEIIYWENGYKVNVFFKEATWIKMIKNW